MEVLPRIADAAVINSSLAVLYIGLPLLLCLLSRYASGNAPAAISLSTVAAAAMALQAMLGPIWQTFIPLSFTGYEPVAWGLILCALIFLYCRSTKQHAYTPPTGDSAQYVALLTIIVVLGISLRLIHPVQQYYLGQSDAYTHLYFIRRIIENGALTNTIYPPGYHWVMALPGHLFPLDPYLIARYGGAFFGALLIIAVWELGGGFRNRRSALVAAFFVSCFPGALLLMKTGVGAYPNQFGLFLLPVILGGYLKSQELYRDRLLLMLLFAGLIVAVPIMSLNLITLIGVDIVARGLTGRLNRSETIPVLLGGVLASTCALFIIHSHQEFFFTSVAIVSDAARPDSVMTGMQALSSDFFKLKRMGFDNVLFDTAVIGMACAISVCFVSALAKRQRTFALISIWAALTLVQTSTGVLQFSSYQRAGWELLISMSLLGGYIYSLLFAGRHRLKLLEQAALVLLFLSALLTFRFYPRHMPTLSNSENSLVSLVWFLDRQSTTEHRSGSLSFEKPERSSPWRDVINQEPQTIITRQFSNFTYGDPVKALLSENTGLKHIPVGSKSKLPPFKKERITSVIIDACFKTEKQQLPASSYLQPNQYRRFRISRDSICELNEKLRQWVETLEDGRWDKHRVTFNNTEAVFISKSIEL